MRQYYPGVKKKMYRQSRENQRLMCLNQGMARCVKVTADKPDGLNFIPRTHMVGGDKLFSDFYMPVLAYPHTTYVSKQTNIKIFNQEETLIYWLIDEI